MEILLGVGLVAASVLIFATVHALYRRPAPPRWTGNDSLTTAICLALTMLFGFAISVLLDGLSNPAGIAEIGSLGLALAGIALSAVIVLSRRMLTRGRAPDTARASI